MKKMYKITDVIRGVSGLIENLFGEAPTSKDITEGFERPCTYVDPGPMSTDSSSGMRHDIYDLDIIRFAARTKLGWIELLKYQESLADALENPIKIDDNFWLYPQDVESNLNREEMTLTVSVTFENYQNRTEDENGEYMEDLKINSRKE